MLMSPLLLCQPRPQFSLTLNNNPSANAFNTVLNNFPKPKKLNETNQFLTNISLRMDILLPKDIQSATKRDQQGYLTSLLTRDQANQSLSLSLFLTHIYQIHPHPQMKTKMFALILVLITWQTNTTRIYITLTKKSKKLQVLRENLFLIQLDNLWEAVLMTVFPLMGHPRFFQSQNLSRQTLSREHSEVLKKVQLNLVVQHQNRVITSLENLPLSRADLLKTLYGALL